MAQTEPDTDKPTFTEPPIYRRYDEETVAESYHHSLLGTIHGGTFPYTHAPALSVVRRGWADLLVHSEDVQYVDSASVGARYAHTAWLTAEDAAEVLRVVKDLPGEGFDTNALANVLESFRHSDLIRVSIGRENRPVFYVWTPFPASTLRLKDAAKDGWTAYAERCDRFPATPGEADSQADTAAYATQKSWMLTRVAFY